MRCSGKRCRERSAAAWFRPMLALLLLPAAINPGAAQQARSSPPIASGGAGAPPIEIEMGTVNGDVRCTPARARLPGRDAIDLRVVNRAERPLWFVAPEFLKGAKHIDSRGFTLDVTRGGFLVAPASTVRVLLRTPQPGEYYYSCYEPGSVPRPESSGFLIVVPAAP